MTKEELEREIIFNDQCKIAHRHRVLSSVEIEYIELHKHDMSCYEMANVLHRNKTSILRYLYRTGVQRKPRNYREPTDTDVIKDYLSVNQNAGNRFLIEKFNVTTNRLKEIRKEMKISTDRRGIYQYTIQCTQQQCEAAKILGAKIRTFCTAEQMTGWLEVEKGISLNIYSETMTYRGNDGKTEVYSLELEWTTRETPYLMAIDSALEFLSKLNKK